MKLFISYAKKDTRKLALALCDALNKIDGLSVWVDRSLRAGKAWELQIQQEIDTCDTMIVLYSPDINRHKNGEPESYVLTEIAYAKYTVNKPIIPVMAQKTTPPIALTMTHYIDFTLDGLTLDDLVEALCAELEIEVKLAIAKVPRPSIAKVTPKPAKSDYASQIRAIIGDPFDLCEVPAGEFLYGDDKRKLTLPTFYIGKYPITYSQYQAFVDDSEGFKDPRWWQGLARNQSNYIHHIPNINNHPLERVSWYESIAFCRWLSYQLHGNYIIDNTSSWLVRLPTEFEWEKAASGVDGRLYPYGNVFDKNRCNTWKSGIGKTTPVTQYPLGASPYGVMDMCGNISEWCLSHRIHPQIEFSKEDLTFSGSRVLRGGAWRASESVARIANRLVNKADDRSDVIGFRIVYQPQPS